NENRDRPGSTRALSSQNARVLVPYSWLKASSASISRPIRDECTSRAAAAREQRELAEVLHQAGTVFGADRLGMELDSPARQAAMTDAHEHAVFRPGDRLQLGRQRLVDAERVVAHGGETL